MLYCDASISASTAIGVVCLTQAAVAQDAFEYRFAFGAVCG